MSKSKHSRKRTWHTAGSFIENAVTDNIVLTQALGLCPIIAAGVSLKNGVVLTVCTAAIMLPINILIALADNRIPKWLRPVLYTVLASLLLVAAAYLMESRISPELYAKLYLFIPLMAVNMLYTHQTGMRSASVPIPDVIVESLGSTVGFGIVICLISSLREMAISGSLWGKPLGYTVTLPEAATPFTAFILLGFLSALLQWCRRRITDYFRRKEEETV